MNPVGFPSFEHYSSTIQKSTINLVTFFKLLDTKLHITTPESHTLDARHIYLSPLKKQSLLAVMSDAPLTTDEKDQCTRAANGIVHGDKLAIHSVVKSFSTPF